MSTLISLASLFTIYVLLFVAVLYRQRAMATGTATMLILQLVSFIVFCVMLVHIATEVVHCYIRSLPSSPEAGPTITPPSPTDRIVHALLECVVLNALAWRCIIIWGSPELLKTFLAPVVVTTSVTRISFAVAPNSSTDCSGLIDCTPTATSPLLKFILPRWTFILHTVLSLAVLVGYICIMRSRHHTSTRPMSTHAASSEDPNSRKSCVSALCSKATPLWAQRAHLIASVFVDSFVLGWVPFAILLLSESGVLSEPHGKALVHDVGTLVPLLFALSYTLMLLMLDIDTRSHRPALDSEAQYELLATSPEPTSECLETDAEAVTDVLVTSVLIVPEQSTARAM